MIRYHATYVARDHRMQSVMCLSAERAVRYLTDTALAAGTVLGETDTHEIVPVAVVREDGRITVITYLGIYAQTSFADDAADVARITAERAALASTMGARS